MIPLNCLDNDEYNIFSLYDNKREISFLLVINDFFINKLINNCNEHNIITIFNSYRTNLILKNLYRYKIIPSDVYYLFSQVICMEYEIFELFIFFLILILKVLYSKKLEDKLVLMKYSMKFL